MTEGTADYEYGIEAHFSILW